MARMLRRKVYMFTRTALLKGFAEPERIEA
ncbi:MAG: hypothetical protein QOH32_1793, partial [Bradyrhizobium sp.]|nr:hypothetical protein [Bradyrhizobium sp.]